MMREEAMHAALQLESRVSRSEARLDSLEAGQKRIESKLDKLIWGMFLAAIALLANVFMFALKHN